VPSALQLVDARRRARRAQNVARRACALSGETRIHAMLLIMRARELHDEASALTERSSQRR
jgi:hypothetical protein